MMQDFETGNPLSVMVSVRVRGHEVQALVNTGACVNVLSHSFVKHFGCLHLLEPHSGQARTVDGSPLDIEGTRKERMQVGDVETTVEYLVAQSIQVVVILGLMFIRTHKFPVDLHSKQFWTGTESSANALRMRGNKQIDALKMVDCQSQRAGITSEADACTGDKDFQKAC